MKMNKNRVLSFSRDQDVLRLLQAALREGGFEVVSVDTESRARFEIEMGRCAALLICFRAGQDTTHDLMDLFRRSCPQGTIVFVANRTRVVVPCSIDRMVCESAGTQAIVEALRSKTS
jgi:DNA-binding response OmpR family regulator